MGSIPAAGNSSSAINYSLTDHQPLRPINYYRLKMVNKDGSFTASETRRVNFEDEGNTVGMFPNPAHNVATLAFAKAPRSNITVKIWNNLGQIIQTYNLTGSRATYNLNVTNIAQGIYHVTVTGEGINEHIKLMIQ